MLKFRFYFSRFLGAFIALLFCASTSSARDFPIQSRASTSPQLVVSQSVVGANVAITGFRRLNLDISKTTLSIGGVDYTSKADVKVNPVNPDILSIKLTLNQALKSQSNLEFKLNTETKESGKLEFCECCGKFESPNQLISSVHR
jgi:hypothetical protein